MKVYKYLPIDSADKLNRLEHTLKTGEIWFSRYNALNDPMEGIYYTHDIKVKIERFRKTKYSILIGSFGSSPNNFHLWAYYANGFKGACLEIEVFDNIEVHGISYVSLEDFQLVINADDDNIIQVLTRKLYPWKIENEKRILITNEIIQDEQTGNLCKIGEITSVHIGINCGLNVIQRLNNFIDKPSYRWYIKHPCRYSQLCASLECTINTLEEYRNRRELIQNY